MVRRRSTVRFRNGAPRELTCEPRSEAHWTALILRGGWELLPCWEEFGRSPSVRALLGGLLGQAMASVCILPEARAVPRRCGRGDRGERARLYRLLEPERRRRCRRTVTAGVGKDIRVFQQAGSGGRRYPRRPRPPRAHLAGTSPRSPSRFHRACASSALRPLTRHRQVPALLLPRVLAGGAG
jgi:hypothetical protein